MAEHQVQHTGVARFQYTRFAATHAFLLPALSEQKAISHVLGLLDEKIAYNVQISATINRLVTAHLDALLAGFDPHSGWSEVSLVSIADINVRKRVPITGGQLRYIDIASVSPGRIDWPELTDWSDAPGRARRGVDYGDVIWSTVRPNRQSHALILDSDESLVASTGFAVLTPRAVGPAYLYGLVTRGEFVAYLESVAEGSAYPAVRADRFALASVPMPPKEKLVEFEEIAFPLRKRSHAADIENRYLSDLRDALLPNLISGELQVKDVDQLVSDAV